MKYSKERALGQLGEYTIGSICAKAGVIFCKIDGSSDVGIDGHIEFTEDSRATGEWIKLQIKCGASFRNVDGSYTFRSDAAHFRLWSQGVLPVAGVVYDPELDIAVWCDITGYLREHTIAVSNGPYHIHIHQGDLFNSNTLKATFKQKMLAHIGRNTAWRSAELLCSEHPSEQKIGLDGLMGISENRFSRLTCELLLTRSFRLEGVAFYWSIHSLARYFPHPEASFFPFSQDLWWYCRRVTGDWGRKEFEFLLSKVDEDGLERGSYGQAVMVLLQSIYDPEALLLEIVLDSNANHNARHYAIGCMEFFGGTRSLIAITNHQERLSQEGLHEPVNWALEYLPDYLREQGLILSEDEAADLMCCIMHNDPAQLQLFQPSAPSEDNR